MDKIYCKEALEVLKELPDESVDLVLTDPPYNINLQPQRKKTNAIENDNMSENAFISFLYPIAKELDRVLKNDRFALVFCGWSTADLFSRIFGDFWDLKSQPVWIKNNFGIGYYTRPQYEPCLLFLKGKPPVLEKAVSDVWKFDRVLKPIHSCEKPLPLMKFLVENFSNEGDVVIDPFCGVGNSLVASKQLGRGFIGCDIVEKYIKVANIRINRTHHQKKLTLLEGNYETKTTDERTNEQQREDDFEGDISRNPKTKVKRSSSIEPIHC